MVPARLETDMSNLSTERTNSLPKYARVAASIRAQIEDGTLSPGASAPSGAALARITGYSALTCRKALGALLKDGVLVPGPSRNARPRVADPVSAPAEQTRADAARALSAALSALRRDAGLTQVELAAVAGASVTTIGHAETGRLWQSRDFWERADKALFAGGELLFRHDAYRAAVAPPDPAAVPDCTAITAPSDNAVGVHSHHLGGRHGHDRSPATTPHVCHGSQ
jgi:DNA-binding transcriptional regulator YhcF (GntR family)